MWRLVITTRKNKSRSKKREHDKAPPCTAFPPVTKFYFRLAQNCFWAALHEFLTSPAHNSGKMPIWNRQKPLGFPSCVVCKVKLLSSRLSTTWTLQIHREVSLVMQAKDCVHSICVECKTCEALWGSRKTEDGHGVTWQIFVLSWD